jgi:hypothetical protein
VCLLHLQQWNLNQLLRPWLQHLNLSLSLNQHLSLPLLSLRPNLLRLLTHLLWYLSLLLNLWLKSHQLLKSNRLSKNRLHLLLKKLHPKFQWNLR